MTGQPGPEEDVLEARAYLCRVAEAGSLPMASFVAEHGPVEAARLIRRASAPPEVIAATAARRLDADGSADIAAGHRHGLTFVTPESLQWPHYAFAPLYTAQSRRMSTWAAGARAPRYGGEPTVPLGLWVRGSLALASVGLQSIAVVGARAATSYGDHVAVEFSYGLAAAGMTVVSGGAFGIDASAHRGALAAGGRTVLVSAAGLDLPYPKAHARLYDEIGESGLLISESPPGCAPHRHRFLSRNRLIAALSGATLVIEAAPRSGALNTVGHCIALGRPVLAVPGPVTSRMSAGCHGLIRRAENPAHLVTNVDEILDVVGPLDRRPTAAHSARNSDNRSDGPRIDDEKGDPAAGWASGSPSDSFDDLDQTDRCVLDGLPARVWVREEQIARRSGVPIESVRRSLPVLLLAGALESGRDGYRLVRRAPTHDAIEGTR